MSFLRTSQDEYAMRLEEVRDSAAELEHCRDMINELIERMARREMPIISDSDFRALLSLCAPVSRFCDVLIQDSLDPGY